MGIRTLAIIEGEPISWDGTTVSYMAKAAVDSDGIGPSHGDPDWQGDTSLHHNGNALNADVDKYIVVPPAIINGVGPVVLGSQARVINRKTMLTTAAVVGDIGPHAKLGEISVACARALGINPSPVNGGEDSHCIHYEITPGLPAVVDGVAYSLQPSRAA